MPTELLTERRGDVLVMTLSGPATRNALSPQVYAAGIESVNMAESDNSVAAIIVTGADGHFCGGGDLQRLAHNRQHDPNQQGTQIDAFHQWMEALRCSPKPVIAAVEGVAAGGGVSLALACDLVVAGDNARFVSAYSRVGLSSDGGASWHLGRQLTRGQALQWLWLGGERSAQQLQQWGLVHQIEPAGGVLNAAQALADQLSRVPAGVLASLKELVNEAPHASLNEQLAAEKRHFMVNLMRQEAGDAIAGFLTRKTP
ncbi:MAG: enoyl-CoA hydratase [Rubrivivax sp.]|nr:MAG: enoyl-CoA hydratase [Rubrivivax sp.]